MEFDVTKLDKVLLLQSLFAHSNPLGLGVSEYKYRKQKGDNVDGLTEEECHILLAEFNENFLYQKINVKKILRNCSFYLKNKYLAKDVSGTKLSKSYNCIFYR